MGGCMTCRDAFRPMVTVPEFKRRAEKKHGSPKDAFDSIDTNKDDELELEELGEGAQDLVPPVSSMEASIIFDKVDKDTSSGIDRAEFYNVVGGCKTCADAFLPDGVSVAEFRKRAEDTHHKPELAFQEFDLGDNNKKLSPQEFTDGCLNLVPKVSAIDAEPLFKKLDADKDGSISPVEFYEKLGGCKICKNKFLSEAVTLPEFRTRTKTKHHSPGKAFNVFDKDDNGKISEEEFIDGGKALNPAVPDTDSHDISDGMDEDGSGDIDASEWNDAMGGCEACTDDFAPNGITVAEFKKRAKAKHDSPHVVFSAFDEDRDGKISLEELGAGAAALEPSVSAADAADLFEALDLDDGDFISPEELYEIIGGCDICQEKFAADGVSLLEFKKRTKAKHETPEDAMVAFDKNADGEITPHEFAEESKNLHPEVSQKHSADILEKLDKDNDGALSQDELYDAFGGCKTCSKKYGPHMEQLRHRLKARHGTPEAAFESIDKIAKRNGVISPEEFVKAVSELNPPISADDAKVLFDQLDDDANGGLDAEEFYDEIGGCRSCSDEFPLEPVSIAEAKKRLKSKYDTPKNAFEATDVAEQDGEISLQEFVDGANKLVPKISVEDAEKLFNGLDKDGGGGVDPEEWFDELGGCEMCSDSFTPSGVTLPIFKERAEAKHKTPKNAFKAFDEGAGKKSDKGDGVLSPEEFENGAVALDPEVPSEDADELFKEMDIDGDGSVTDAEFYKVAGGKDSFGPDGVTVQQFKKRVKAKFTDPKDAFDMADIDQDSKISATELVAAGKQLDPPVGALDATELLKKIDKNGDGNINESEFNEALGGCKVCNEEFAPNGATIPQLKARLEAKHKTPQKTLDELDSNNDGKISQEEFVKLTSELEPPIKVEDAVVLYEKLDKNGNGNVEKEEAFDQFGGCAICSDKFAPRGVTLEMLAKRLKDRYKTPKGAFDAFKGNDGSVSIQELAKAAAELDPPVSAREAARLFHELDSDDSDGLNAEEFFNGLGGCKTCSKDFVDNAADVGQLKKGLRESTESPEDAFGSLDVSLKDGKISIEELAEGLKKLNPPIGTKEAATLFGKLDENGDGGIDPSEFNEALGGCKTCSEAFGVPVSEFRERAKAKHETPKKALEAFDKDKDGKLPAEELVDAGKSLEPPVSADDSKDILKKLDKNDDGKLDESEFVDGMGGCTDCGDEFFPNKVDVPFFAKKTKAAHGSAQKAFDAIDVAEKDGKITLEELVTDAKSLKPPLMAGQVEELFKKLNKNDDAALSKEEFFDALGEVLPVESPELESTSTSAPERTVEPELEIATASGTCRCPKDVSAEEDTLVIDEANGACSIDEQSGVMTVKVIGAKSRSPACMLRPQPPSGMPPPQASAPWFAQIFRNEIELNPDQEVDNPRSINFLIKLGVFEDTCGRSTGAIKCSQPGATQQLVLSTWGVTMD